MLTDPSTTDPAHHATWTFTCQVRSQSLLDSYSAAMSVINLLCISVFHHELHQGQERLKRIETLHDELDELDALSWLARRQTDKNPSNPED